MCAKDSLTTATAGKLTIGTDNPAYPPYYAPNAGGKLTAPWKISDPTNGQGFESAVAYAIADKLGFAKGDVAWVVVPFANSYAPGPKTFDLDLNQVNYKAERTQTADLSKGYYFGNQALVVLKASPLAKATSVAALKDYVYGAQVGTTSYDAIASVIAPTKKALVYDTNDLAIKALSNKTIDGLVVDLPTADYITNVQIDNGAAIIAGQFQGGTPGILQRRAGQGQPVDRVRQQGDRCPDPGRHAQGPGQHMAPVPGQGPGLPAVIGAGSGRPGHDDRHRAAQATRA